MRIFRSTPEIEAASDMANALSDVLDQMLKPAGWWGRARAEDIIAVAKEKAQARTTLFSTITRTFPELIGRSYVVKRERVECSELPDEVPKQQ